MVHTVVIAGDRSGDVAEDFVGIYEAHYPRSLCAPSRSGVWTGRPPRTSHRRRSPGRSGTGGGSGSGTNPPGYVYRTAFRLSRSHWRREDTLPPEQASRNDTAAEAVSNLALEAALGQMPARRRACATLCFVVGLTPRETARTLGIAEGTVRKQLGMARDDLRHLISEPRAPA